MIITNAEAEKKDNKNYGEYVLILKHLLNSPIAENELIWEKPVFGSKTCSFAGQCKVGNLIGAKIRGVNFLIQK